MSNRTRLPPPAEVLAFARAYRCTDCTGRAGKPRRQHGQWHLDIRHDNSCPVLTGVTSRTAAGLSAAAAAAKIGKGVLYIGDVSGRG